MDFTKRHELKLSIKRYVPEKIWISFIKIYNFTHLRDLYNWYSKFYNSKAFLGLLSHNNSNGFSNASLTATKNPTDSLPSIILWS